MTPDDIETTFVREFSGPGNVISVDMPRSERRERVRQAIYVNCRMNDAFPDDQGTTVVMWICPHCLALVPVDQKHCGSCDTLKPVVFTYAEAFRLCYGERLDRRAATHVLPENFGI
jgi:hypothetical protein